MIFIICFFNRRFICEGIVGRAVVVESRVDMVLRWVYGIFR